MAFAISRDLPTDPLDLCAVCQDRLGQPMSLSPSNLQAIARLYHLTVDQLMTFLGGPDRPEPLAGHRASAETPLQHPFHASCAFIALRQQANCPLCRLELPGAAEEILTTLLPIEVRERPLFQLLEQVRSLDDLQITASLAFLRSERIQELNPEDATFLLSELVQTLTANHESQVARLGLWRAPPPLLSSETASKLRAMVTLLLSAHGPRLQSELAFPEISIPSERRRDAFDHRLEDLPAETLIPRALRFINPPERIALLSPPLFDTMTSGYLGALLESITRGPVSPDLAHTLLAAITHPIFRAIPAESLKQIFIRSWGTHNPELRQAIYNCPQFADIPISTKFKCLQLDPALYDAQHLALLQSIPALDPLSVKALICLMLRDFRGSGHSHFEAILDHLLARPEFHQLSYSRLAEFREYDRVWRTLSLRERIGAEAAFRLHRPPISTCAQHCFQIVYLSVMAAPFVVPPLAALYFWRRES